MGFGRMDADDLCWIECWRLSTAGYGRSYMSMARRLCGIIPSSFLFFILVSMEGGDIQAWRKAQKAGTFSNN